MREEFAMSITITECFVAPLLFDRAVKIFPKRFLGTYTTKHSVFFIDLNFR